MLLTIRNATTGVSSEYTARQLLSEARRAVKGLGKLTDYVIQVNDENGAVQLCASYQVADRQSFTTVRL